MKYLIIFITLLLLLFSCLSSEEKDDEMDTIFVNPQVQQELKFSELFKSMEYVFLDTDEGGLIGTIRKLEIVDDKIFHGVENKVLSQIRINKLSQWQNMNFVNKIFT